MGTERVPVHVIGGFLGAGKTTALVSLLDGPLLGESVAVVVNDFGEGAVDEATVGERRVSIAEIRGACVCCTAPEGFVGAVGRLLDDVAPDRILVEPTGIARPADLIDTLRRAPYASRLDLRPLLVLVDPMMVGGAHQALIEEQAAAADVLVASRTDLATVDALEAFDAWAGSLWPGPQWILKTSGGVLPVDVLDWAPGSGPRTPPSGSMRTGRMHAHHEHDGHDHGSHGTHGFIVKTYTFPPDIAFSRARLLQAMGRIGKDGAVVRFKGLFRTDQGWTRFELAGGRVHEAPTSWRRDSRLDAIVDAGATWTEVVHHALTDARLTEDEVRGGAEAVEVGLPDGSARRFDRFALAALPGGVADVAPLLPGRTGQAARVTALLDAVGAADGWHAVVVAADGYTTTPVPVSALRAGLLLHAVDGGPLPSGQGGPIRLMIPGDAGPGGACANVKSVVRIALRAP